MHERKLEIVGVGPQKTATSWLAEVLEGAPMLCFPSGVKETFFWDRKFDAGLHWYFSHFKCDGRCIEFGPTYFHSLEAISRLKTHNPELRIIITLRDPAARAWSLHQHHRRKGRVGDDFEEAMSLFPEIIDAGRYATHVPRWIEAFGSDQVLVLLQDEVERDPRNVIERICGLIGERIDPDELELYKRVNVGGIPPSLAAAKVATRVTEVLRGTGFYSLVNLGKRLGLKEMVYGAGQSGPAPMPPKLRSRLVSEFEQDIGFIERFLRVDLSDWRRT